MADPAAAARQNPSDLQSSNRCRRGGTHSPTQAQAEPGLVSTLSLRTDSRNLQWVLLLTAALGLLQLRDTGHCTDMSRASTCGALAEQHAHIAITNCKPAFPHLQVSPTSHSPSTRVIQALCPFDWLVAASNACQAPPSQAPKHGLPVSAACRWPLKPLSRRQ